jgi:hypothetical protein
MNELYRIQVQAITLSCKVDIRTARRWKAGQRGMLETLPE